ncbi:hypothetical protein FA15DRAFT_709729 [Coprinopsis marcescibilis]|uniref:SAGA-associated factor 11 n=1 Tax=Coprinopsis marcescibilis TaxID=230819 RepID=A0A5C3KFI4_COPMA|nr:hypothetical protein FA15DRAFT_709729 [Coprinopsis marcescibilis]
MRLSPVFYALCLLLVPVQKALASNAEDGYAQISARDLTDDIDIDARELAIEYDLALRDTLDSLSTREILDELYKRNRYFKKKDPQRQQESREHHCPRCKRYFHNSVFYAHVAECRASHSSGGGRMGLGAFAGRMGGPAHLNLLLVRPVQSKLEFEYKLDARDVLENLSTRELLDELHTRAHGRNLPGIIARAKAQGLLKAHHLATEAAMQCPNCKGTFDPAFFQAHVSGCTALKSSGMGHGQAKRRRSKKSRSGYDDILARASVVLSLFDIPKQAGGQSMFLARRPGS